MKGIGIQSLVGIALVFIVAFFVFSIGGVLMQDISEDYCTGTWITNTSLPFGGLGVNPIYAANFGCCSTLDSGNNCTVWDTTRSSLNVSGQGLESIEEFSSWGPTLALVVIASIIIGVLVTYLARGTRY